MFIALWLSACTDHVDPPAVGPEISARVVTAPRQTDFCPDDPLTAVEITSLAPSGDEVVFGTRLRGPCGGREATVWATGMSPTGLGSYPPAPADDAPCANDPSEARVFGVSSVAGHTGFTATASSCTAPDISLYSWAYSDAQPGWNPTGLSAHLTSWYSGAPITIPQMGMGGGACGTAQSSACSVVAVEPRAGDRGPSLWTGPEVGEGIGPQWFSEPFLDLSGVSAPVAASVSVVSRDNGALLVGTSITGLSATLPGLGVDDCADPASFACARPRLLHLDDGVLEEVWRGAADDPPVVATAHHMVGDSGLAWAVTDAPTRLFDLVYAQVLREDDLSDLMGPDPFHPTFLIALHEERDPERQDWPEVRTLLLGGYTDGDGPTRVAYRCIGRPDWTALEIPEVGDPVDVRDFDESAVLQAAISGDELLLALGRVTGPAPNKAAGRVIAVSGIRGLCE